MSDVDCPNCGYSGPTWEHKCRAQRFLDRVAATVDLDVCVMASSEMPDFDGLRTALTAEREAHAETKAALERLRTAHEATYRAHESAQQETARLRALIERQDKRVAEADGDVVDAESALLQMTRAWATELLAQIGGAWLAEEMPGIPAPVAALVREHAGKPVGACQDPECGQRAPLVETFNRRNSTERWLVCAWGCTPALRATRNGGTDTE